MGEIVVDAELENPGGRALFERGYGKESDVRRTTMTARTRRSVRVPSRRTIRR